MINQCHELIMATEILIKLMFYEKLPQVILHAKPQLVEMALKSFQLDDWQIVKKDNQYTVLKNLKISREEQHSESASGG